MNNREMRAVSKQADGPHQEDGRRQRERHADGPDRDVSLPVAGSGAPSSGIGFQRVRHLASDIAG